MSGLQYYLSQQRKKEAFKGGILMGSIVLLFAAFLIYGLYSNPANASKTFSCSHEHGKLTCVSQ